MTPAARARVTLPDALDRLTTDELRALIRQAHLGREDERIATLYLLDIRPQVEIGAELNISRSAVSRRTSGIVRRLSGRIAKSATAH